MDKIYTPIIKSQLTALFDSIEDKLTDDSALLLVLSTAIKSIENLELAQTDDRINDVVPRRAQVVRNERHDVYVNDEEDADPYGDDHYDRNAELDDEEDDVEPHTPEGFTPEGYQAFLDLQEEALAAVSPVDEETGERLRPDGVVGTLVDEETGELNDVGNLDDYVPAINAIVAQMEEDAGEEIQVENTFTITYIRQDDNELSANQVRQILDHPVSGSIKHLGSLAFIGINETDRINKKEAVFGVLEEGPISLKALAINAATYAGSHVFPGIGLVQAVGNVNFR